MKADLRKGALTTDSFSHQRTETIENVLFAEVHRIENNAFSKLVNLKRFYGSDIQLEIIEANAFYGTTSLISLYLGGNNITSIQDSFESLVNLISLDLDKKKLTSIPANLLSPMGELDSLHLRLKSISHVVFPSKLTFVNLKVVGYDGPIEYLLPERDWSAHDLQKRASDPAIKADKNNLMKLLQQLPFLREIFIVFESQLDVQDLNVADLHHLCPELNNIMLNGIERSLPYPRPRPAAASIEIQAPHSENVSSGSSHHRSQKRPIGTMNDLQEPQSKQLNPSQRKYRRITKEGRNIIQHNHVT